MEFHDMLDFYENKGVIYNMTTDKFYSLKGTQLKQADYYIYKQSEWKLVAMEQLDFFNAFEITFLKEVLNEKKTFKFDYMPTLKKFTDCIKDAFWKKDDEKIVSCLQDMLLLQEPYPNL